MAALRLLRLSDLGITPEVREDYACYIADRLQVLKNDKRAVFTAASQAQKAVEFLHGLQPGNQREALAYVTNI